MTQSVEHRATVITSLNLKGGVGKTHLCWLIASVCQERHRRCLVLDLDKQGNITSSLLPDGNLRPGTDQFFNPAVEADLDSLIHRSEWSHLDIIPGSFALERFNLTDPTAWQTSGLQESLVAAIQDVGPRYDFVLLDCPPDISLITYAALCASDFVIVPLEAAQWGALGTQHVVKTCAHQLCQLHRSQLLRRTRSPLPNSRRLRHRLPRRRPRRRALVPRPSRATRKARRNRQSRPPSQHSAVLRHCSLSQSARQYRRINKADGVSRTRT